MSLIYPKESLSVYPKHLSPEYKSTVKRSLALVANGLACAAGLRKPSAKASGTLVRPNALCSA